jgi:hypothetical protein
MTAQPQVMTRSERDARYMSLLGDLSALQQMSAAHHEAVDQRLGRIRGTIIALHESYNLQPVATSLGSDVH